MKQRIMTGMQNNYLIKLPLNFCFERVMEKCPPPPHAQTLVPTSLHNTGYACLGRCEGGSKWHLGGKGYNKPES